MSKEKVSQIEKESKELNNQINLMISKFEKKHKVQRIGSSEIGFFINLDWI